MSKRGTSAPRRLFFAATSPVLLLVFASACTLGGARERAFSGMLQSGDVNSSVGLSSIDAYLTPSNGVFVALQIENRANERVVFPPAYGARGFIWLDADGAWEEIPNEVVYPDVGFELGPAGGSRSPFMSTVNFASTDPRIPEVRNIRILVQGSLEQNDVGTIRKVEAFVDVDMPR